MQTTTRHLLKAALIQCDLHWEDIEQNLIAIEAILDGLEPDVRLVVLPEMFATGFTMTPSKFSHEQLQMVFAWMHQQSTKRNIVLTGSSIAPVSGGYYNQFMIAQPDGTSTRYNKRHLFRMGEEHQTYLPGNDRVVVEVDGWRICPMICYDLRFPVWSRNRNDYDMLIYVANWPASRREIWLTLLRARAIENQCFVLGVNRVGKDPYATYLGDSLVFSPKGEIVSIPVGDKPGVATALINGVELEHFRKKFPAWMDADSFDIDNGIVIDTK